MHTKRFINFIQSGMYFDYIIKKIVEIFLRNCFIYSSTFFAEKFMIEFLSKKVIDNFTFYYNLQFVNRDYSYTVFYNNIVVAVSIFLFLVECFFFYI